MGIVETIVLYSLVGLVVAAAFVVWQPIDSLSKNVVLFGTHLLLWPIFAPVLLGRAVDASAHGDTSHDRPSRISPDFDNAQISEVEKQLMEALDTVGGIAEELLGGELENIRRLSDSLATMDRRIAEMDALLGSDEFDRQQAERTLKRLLDDPDIAEDDDRIESVRARLRNIDRLMNMRDRARRDLDRAVLKMEEMISQILLLQFADQPEEEIAENIHEIASTIDGLSEGLLTV